MLGTYPICWNAIMIENERNLLIFYEIYIEQSPNSTTTKMQFTEKEWIENGFWIGTIITVLNFSTEKCSTFVTANTNVYFIVKSWICMKVFLIDDLLNVYLVRIKEYSPTYLVLLKLLKNMGTIWKILLIYLHRDKIVWYVKR